MTETLLTAAQVAERLGVSRQRVNVYIQTGRLAAAKVGSFWLVESAVLDAFKRLPSGRPRKR